MSVDNHVTVNGLPLQVFQDAEKRDEIEQHRQDEIAGMKHRTHIMTSAGPAVKRKQFLPRGTIDLMQAEVQRILEQFPDGLLYDDITKLMSMPVQLTQLHYITGPLRLGCIKWKVINPTTNSLFRGLTMLRLRHDGEAMPEVRRQHRRKAADQVVERIETPADLIVPGIPKAPLAAPTIAPIVGSVRAELVLFARAQRRLERLRLVYQAKIAKLDRIHAKNWSKLARRLVLAEPVTKGNGNGRSDASHVVDHHATRQG